MEIIKKDGWLDDIKENLHNPKAWSLESKRTTEEKIEKAKEFAKEQMGSDYNPQVEKRITEKFVRESKRPGYYTKNR